MAKTVAKKTCFIIMPITTPDTSFDRYKGDKDHFIHVMECLFVPAIKAAKMKPIRPIVTGTEVIQSEIIKNLQDADLVLCDMSTLNANVFFEFGIRTALNLPVCVVRDEHTKIPFDTSVLNCVTYTSALNVWETDGQLEKLSQHITATMDGDSGDNPLWRQFCFAAAAQTIRPASGEDGRIEMLHSDIVELKALVKRQGVDSGGQPKIDDAPACDVCGSTCVRNGAYYRCFNCGNRMEKI